MNIRPKNFIIKAATGVRFSDANANGANWRALVFNNYRLHLLDLLAAYGEGDDYGHWLNEMLSRHANLYQKANNSGDWQSIAYEDADVGKYQQDYRGGIGNDGNYQRHGTIKLRDTDRYDFNQTGIKTNLNTRYSINNPPSRTSGDFSREGYNYKVDNYYSAITDDRRLLGRKGDWDENSNEYKLWIADLNKTGWTMELDPTDNYYKLKRWSNPETVNNPPSANPLLNPTDLQDPNQVPVGHQEGGYGFDWSKLGEGLKKMMPDLLEAGRLAGTLASNSKVYDAKLKGIRPNLQQTYLTHRQVVGDEATKLAYYKRAAAGQTKAGRAFTSDADRLMAYMMEARRVGDELRAQGDLADNQEIRRTSDESNQHLWDNTRRRTEVANANRLALNQANAAKQDLIALKHAANWSSWNNYLTSIEHRARQKQAKNEAIQDQIKLLDYLNELVNDDEYAATRKALNDALVAADYDSTDPKVIAAKKAFENASYTRRRKYLESVLHAKSGIKITHKRKDDLLYKTARDVVEHFRKMSKMSDDSTQRSRTKPIKLSPHPKSATRKMLQGGVAPFSVFTPVTLGGETTTSSQATDLAGGSKKSEKKNDILDVIKDLFGKVDGLYSDTTAVYDNMKKFLARSSVFGDELSTDDIASMYLQQMLQINLLKRNKEAFDLAKTLATLNDALNEFAVDYAGRIIVLDSKDGELKLKSWSEVKEAKGLYNPLTNSLVLNMRAYSPNMKFNNDILNVVNNGIGMSKIAEFIKNHTPKPGTSEETIEGFTKHESNQIRQGLELLREAPAGDYKFTKYTKTLQEQANAALHYIASILPNNMKSILNIHADMNGTSVEGMLTSLVSSGLSNNSKLEFDPLTGKAAKKSGDGSDDGPDAKIRPTVAFFMGMGDRNIYTIQDGTSDGLKVLTNSMPILDSSLHNTGAITLAGIGATPYGSQLDLNSATMGDAKISVNGMSLILVSDGFIHSTELPIDKNAAAQGIIKPDLSFLKKIEKADELLRAMGITDKSANVDVVNKVYSENGLPILYSNDGSGKPVLTSEYTRFAIVNGFATENAFEDDDPEFNDGIMKMSGKELYLFEDTMKLATGNDKYKVDKGWFGGLVGGDNIYKGMIYIPMRSSTITALAGTDYKAPADEYMQIDSLLQQRDNALNLGYNNPGSISNAK